MIILHAGWIEERIWFWGEMSKYDQKESSIPSNKKTRSKTKLNSSTRLPFPYDTPFSELYNALQKSGYSKIHQKKDEKKVIAWLPTQGEQAIASHALIDAPPTSRSKIEIAPWEITTLPCSMDDAISLLCNWFDSEMPSPGIKLGEDCKYWVHVVRFACRLLIQQQYIPDVVQIKTSWFARWRLIFSGDNLKKKDTILHAMPAVCRALSLDRGSEPNISSETVFNQFIESFTNAVIRLESNDQESSTSLKITQRRILPKNRQKKNSHSEFDSLHDQWLHALRSSDPEIKGSPADMIRFVEQIHTWQRPIYLSTSTPFRLCFRLEEPSQNVFPSRTRKRIDSKSWYIRYFLQSTSDPSLLIDIKEVWKNQGKKIQLLRRSDFSPIEYLLYSLGEASKVCSFIDESLKTSKPEGYPTDTNGALNFFQENTLLLEQMGFGVLLPAWWTGKGTQKRLSFQARVKSQNVPSGGRLSLAEIVHFEWKMALGDEEISIAELQELAELKTTLVQVRGHWVYIRPEEIEAAIEFWKKKANTQGTLQDVILMALGKNPNGMNFEFSGVTATGWIATFLDRLKGNESFEECSPPSQFHGLLRPYQLRGYSWLSFLCQWGLGACLADDMGLGKTIQTLVLIQRDWHQNGKKPVLLVCPTSVVGNWQKEASRFTPELPVMVQHGMTRKKGASFKKEAQKQAIILTSYSLLYRDFDILKDIDWNGIILDEAQNIKNPTTKQAKAARSIPAAYRIALTGTPVENHVEDLWSIMEFLNPGFLGNQNQFKKNFFIPIQVLHDTGAIQRLQRMTAPFILRRLKTDKSIISDLPEKLEMKVYCNLTKEQASLYTAIIQEVEDQLDSVEGIQRKGIVLATLSKLKQVCNHPAHFMKDNSVISGRSGKLERLTEMLDELISIKEKALIFTQFTEMGEILHSYLQEQFGQEVFFLHGGTSKKQRDRMVDSFQGNNGIQLFILSLKAGGTGLTLTQANHVFHYDRWWNPAVENQATDRVFRIGQTKNVQVHKFLCVGTLEERIDELIESKKEVAEGVVGTGEAWLSELSTQDLKKLFTLGENAVSE